jgi:hypothetical protein
MNKAYRLFKEALLRRYPVCEVCGFRRATQVGHCLYHVHGGIYDSFENCQSNCPICNSVTGRANWRSEKVRHWHKRVSEGYDMAGWNEQVPWPRRERFGEQEE